MTQEQLKELLEQFNLVRYLDFQRQSPLGYVTLEFSCMPVLGFFVRLAELAQCEIHEISAEVQGSQGCHTCGDGSVKVLVSFTPK